jgi:hypothetical protein
MNRSFFFLGGGEGDDLKCWVHLFLLQTHFDMAVSLICVIIRNLAWLRVSVFYNES